MTAAVRYWHTLRHLKPVQFWGRLWFRLYRPSPDLRSAPALRQQEGRWRHCARNASMTGPQTFHFLNRREELTLPNGWQRQDLPLLWLYNLHYFDDLNACEAHSREAWHRHLIRSWIDTNPPGQGAGWGPYPISLRLVNWIKWRLARHPVDPETLHSLAVQTRWLRRCLEIHLLGNHLWANAKALVFAGTFFSGGEADAWRALGLRLVRRELNEQILPDGGHFERSPMYHAIVLEDLLDLLQLAQLYRGALPEEDVSRWRALIGPMFRWLRLLSHPDGDPAFFNDTAIGIAPTVAALGAYADSLELPSNTEAEHAVFLPNSGYARMQSGEGVLIADVGEIGPDYLPGHAHADTLSFEFSLFARRLIVNSGIDRYGLDAERLRQRGTAAHSTVEVDGQDSSEVWSGFRVARRARPFDLEWKSESDVHHLACSHDGYRRLPGKVTHRREWHLSSSSLVVKDLLGGELERAVARFYLHPKVKVVQSDISGCQIEVEGRPVVCSIEGGELAVIDSTWHPEFGKTVSNRCLEVTLSTPSCETRFSW